LPCAQTIRAAGLNFEKIIDKTSNISKKRIQMFYIRRSKYFRKWVD